MKGTDRQFHDRTCLGAAELSDSQSPSSLDVLMLGLDCLSVCYDVLLLCHHIAPYCLTASYDETCFLLFLDMCLEIEFPDLFVGGDLIIDADVHVESEVA